MRSTSGDANTNTRGCDQRCTPPSTDAAEAIVTAERVRRGATSYVPGQPNTGAQRESGAAADCCAALCSSAASVARALVALPQLLLFAAVRAESRGGVMAGQGLSGERGVGRSFQKRIRQQQRRRRSQRRNAHSSTDWSALRSLSRCTTVPSPPPLSPSSRRRDRLVARARADRAASLQFLFGAMSVDLSGPPHRSCEAHRSLRW